MLVDLRHKPLKKSIKIDYYMNKNKKIDHETIKSV